MTPLGPNSKPRPSLVAEASRQPSSLLQKLGLVAFGFFLAVLALETALRLGGFIVLSLREHRNAVALRQKGAYRILCIGESTTEGQYPVFLEQALNGRNLGIRFSVIDRGIGGTNSSALVDRMEADLEAYRPDMVIAMMGINDRGPHMPYEPDTNSRFVRFIRTLRTYKLARIAWMHIASTGRRAGRALHEAVTARWESIWPKARPAPTREAAQYKAYMELGRIYKEQGNFAEAAAAFEQALKINPRDEDAYVGLGNVFQSEGKSAKAVAAFEQALKINPRDTDVYMGLGATLRDQGESAKAAAAFKC